MVLASILLYNLSGNINLHALSGSINLHFCKVMIQVTFTKSLLTMWRRINGNDAGGMLLLQAIKGLY
jgi:hypothetical protein